MSLCYCERGFMAVRSAECKGCRHEISVTFMWPHCQRAGEMRFMLDIPSRIQITFCWHCFIDFTNTFNNYFITFFICYHSQCGEGSRDSSHNVFLTHPYRSVHVHDPSTSPVHSHCSTLWSVSIHGLHCVRWQSTIWKNAAFSYRAGEYWRY